MMNFMEAVKEIKEGKKVRRECWEFEQYYTKNNSEELVNECGNKPIRLLDNIEATDWEIVEEIEEKKQSLSDKEVPYCHSCRRNAIETKDIKEAIKEFIDWIYVEVDSSTPNKEVEKKAKELFGKRLIK